MAAVGINRKWLWGAGVLAAATALLAAGMPLTTLILLAAALACPAAMFFGMRGAQSGSSGMASHPDMKKSSERPPSSTDSGSTEGSEPALRT